VVNMIAVAEIAYLFNVRYLHGRSLTIVGTLGTPRIWAALGILTAAQFLFTYSPAMNRLFHSAPLPLTDWVIIIGLGAVLLLVLEIEKMVLRRLGVFEELRN
jgi:magnesium-transporting ATPase (P-type)